MSFVDNGFRKFGGAGRDSQSMARGFLFVGNGGLVVGATLRRTGDRMLDGQSQKGDEMMRTTRNIAMAFLTLAAVAMVGIALMGASANAANLYSSGTKTWDTTTTNWGTVHGGPYNTATWSDGDSAFIEGASHTVTLGEDIDLAGLTFYDNGPGNGKQSNESDFIVQGNTLNFSVGAEIKAHLTYKTQGRSSATIKSAITGSPDMGISDNNHHLYLAPDSGS